MSFRDKWSISIVIAIGLVTFGAAAEAQQPFEITDFWFAKVTMLSESKELTVLSSEVWGITNSDNNNKLFNNLTSHCMSLRTFVAGKPQSRYFIVNSWTEMGIILLWKLSEGKAREIGHFCREPANGRGSMVEAKLGLVLGENRKHRIPATGASR